MKLADVPFDRNRPFAPESCVYTFIENDGTNINIASGLLRNWCVKTKPPVTQELVYRELFEVFLRQNAINLDRLESLTPSELCEPIIFCERPGPGPTLLLVDGHHRYSFAVLMGRKTIHSWRLSPKQWQPFIIEDMPQITQEQLTAIPPKPGA